MMLVKTVTRKLATSSPVFPWFFTSSAHIERKPVNIKLDSTLRSAFETGFQCCYPQILRSLVAQDIDVLRTCLESVLCTKIESDLSYLTNQGLHLELLHDESFIPAKLFNARRSFGVPLHRNQCGLSKYEESSLSMPFRDADIKLYTVVNLNDFSLHDLLKSEDFTEILRVDCYIQSKMKLLVVNKDGEVVQGNRNEETEEHLLQLETLVSEETKNQWLPPKELKMEDYSWIIADIDRVLNGNPYPVG